jgi:3-oxoacyl-[acyl-carrier protein] reductase
MGKALVLGASGAIGSAVVRRLEGLGHTCVLTTSSPTAHADWLHVTAIDCSALTDTGPYDAVVWAQGLSTNDSTDAWAPEGYDAVMDANVRFVMNTVARLVDGNAVAPGARLVIVGSLWGLHARPGKLSYTVSKSALGGVVRAVAADLGNRGITVNQVCPGPVDTPMTRATLATEQIAVAAAAVPANRLVSVDDVVSLIVYLATENTGITGQSIAVDLGLSVMNLL